jgi:hypothetical protein
MQPGIELRWRILQGAALITACSCSLHHDASVATASRFVEDNACPFEGCTYGEWVALGTTLLFDSFEGQPRSRGLAPGDKIRALEGKVVAQAVRATVTHADAEFDAGLRAGDEILVLYPLGEGAVRIVHRGQARNSSMDLAYRAHGTDPNPTLQWTWWVHVRTADGVDGWIKDPRDFSGWDTHQ